MLKFINKSLLLALIVVFFQVSAAAQEFKIAPEKTLEQTIAGGAAHSYPVELKSGDFLRIKILQNGADVVVRLFSADNKQILERDAPNGTTGEESLSWAVGADGNYRIEVKLLDAKAVPGNYAINLEKPRPVDDKARWRIAAEDNFAAAQVLQQNPENPENLKAALLKLEAAEKNFARVEDIYWHALTLEVDGGVRSALKDWRGALPRYDNSRGLYAILNNVSKQIEILNVIGVLYSNLQESPNAIDFYTRSAELAAKNANANAQALALSNRGTEYTNLKNSDKALLDYEKAAELYESGGNLSAAAATLGTIADVYYGRKDIERTKKIYEEIIRLHQKSANRAGEAEALNKLGVIYGANKNRAKAIELQTRALQIYREIGDRAEIALMLKNLGVNSSANADNAAALTFYLAALETYLAIDDLKNAAALYENIIDVYEVTKQKDKVVPAYQKQIELFRRLKDVRGEAVALNRIAVFYGGDDLIKGKEYAERALALIRTIDDKSYEAQILYNTAVDYTVFNEYERAIAIFEQVLAIRRKLNEKIGTADAFYRIGQTYSRMSRRDTDDLAKALENLNSALEIYRAEKNEAGAAQTLNEIGGVYINRGELSAALGYLNQSLALARKIENRRIEAETLHNFALGYRNANDVVRSLDYQRQTLELFRKTENRLGETAALNEIGQTYNELGNYVQALDYFTQALKLAEKTGDKDRQATALGRIASVYISQGNFRKSIEFSEKALKLFREFGDKEREATALINIGNAYGSIYDTSKALEYVLRGLSLAQESGNLNSQSIALQGIAMVYYLEEDYPKSFEYLQQALPLARALDQRETEASLFSNLMKLFKYQNKPRAAIFYGKQSINLYQRIRASLKGVDKDLQQSYLKSNEDKYRALADLLIQVGRLPEAQQVLGMLKEEEYSEFVQRGAGEAAKLLGNIELSPEETDAVARYEKIADTLTAKGAEYEKLKKLRPTTPEEQAQLKAKLETYKADLDAASRTLDVVLRQIETEFSKPETKTDVTATLQANKGLQSDLKVWKLPNTVFLSTVVSDNNYYVILTTPTVQVAGKSAITAADLNKLVQDFRAAVDNPCACIDPRPLGEKLYNVLIKPIEPNLAELERQANGKPLTLAWSLDGSLRYLPLAALWDGKQYLAQKYQNVLFTLASRTRLPLAPSAQWRGLGLGVTQAWGDFPALPSVKNELLQGAIQNEGDAASKGSIPGRVFLDKQFSEANFAAELGSGDYPLVHIASHFALKPGNETKSYLLLGDGSELSLDKIRHSPDFSFAGVELLTLSACNTATGGSGKEVEGLAYVAQDKGAMAVLATLWAVADESTQSLMSEFYRQRQEKNLSKAEALRQSQLALLDGTFKGDGKQVTRSKLGGVTTADGTPFVTDPAKPFAHPYFWSPFVLIGNWR